MTGADPWAGGLGFTNPDNLAINNLGNLWIVTDRSARSGASDRFGNNRCWVVPRDDGEAEQAACFATGPMECELCGISMDPQQRALFLAIQHPGDVHGRRTAGAEETQRHSLRDRLGRSLQQMRTVPPGSNWPAQALDRHHSRAGGAIQRQDGQLLLGG